MNTQPQTTGSIIDTLFHLREQKRELESQVKEINGAMNDLKDELMNRYAAEETDMSRGKQASATLTKTDTFSIEDYDSLQDWVFENNALFVFQRRLSSAAIKELMESGEEVPGVKKFVKYDISLRKI